jgi:hypothetical protein
MKNRKNIPLTGFKRLLHDIRDRRPDVHVRIRLLGQMWSEYFYEVLSITSEELLLFNEKADRYLKIPRIDDVIQFELECSFFGYQAYYHYDVSVTEQKIILSDN